MSVKWTVLVGMNGAGKSSLLSKMKSGEAVEGVELGENTIFIENLGGVLFGEALGAYLKDMEDKAVCATCTSLDVLWAIHDDEKYDEVMFLVVKNGRVVKKLSGREARELYEFSGMDIRRSE